MLNNSLIIAKVLETNFPIIIWLNFLNKGKYAKSAVFGSENFIKHGYIMISHELF